MVIFVANANIAATYGLPAGRADLLVLSLVAPAAHKLPLNFHVRPADALPALAAHKALGVVILVAPQRDG